MVLCLHPHHARGEPVIHAWSMALRTLVASTLVHASVVLAVATGSRAGAKGADPGPTIDIERNIAVESWMNHEPRPAVTADERVPPPHVRAPTPPNPSHMRVGAAFHPTKVTALLGEDRSGAEPPPAVLTAVADDTPRFVMAFGAAATTSGGLSKTGESGDAPPETYPETGVSSRARLLRGAPPEYPAAARAAAVEAKLPLDIVVDPSGSVVEARLLDHAGYGLDEAALRAVRAYRFAPAQRDGRGVRVRMRWVVDFRLD